MFVSNNNRIGLTSVLLSGAIATTLFASPVNAIGRSLPNIPKHTTESTNTAPKLIDSSATSQSPGARCNLLLSRSRFLKLLLIR